MTGKHQDSCDPSEDTCINVDDAWNWMVEKFATEEISSHSDTSEEIRIQVDRRKLEHMISSNRDPEINEFHQNSAAEDFFSEVMRNTGAYISWPSRLKIGAKTKKDPYVKISGLPDQINAAKEQVLAVLRTRQNRVTLKIDVPFTDHSHIIGRGGKNTQMVMKETGCHIHFPDSNKNSDFEKSNQVSIAGPINGVEKAREIIRSLAPLAVTFDLKNVRKEVDVGNLSSHPALEFETGTTDITVLIRPNRSSGQPFVLLRGSVRQEASIRQAFRRLSEKLFPPKLEVQCAVSLDIMPAQQETVLGPHGLNMATISNLTRTMIHYPPSERKGATTFFIRGTLDGVLNARKQIIGFLPVSLNFEVNCAPACDVVALERELNVSVSIKPKRGSDSLQSVAIKTQELNCSKLYLARDKITGIFGKEEPVSCSEYDFMHKLQYPAQQIMHHSPINGLPAGAAALHVSPVQGMAALTVASTGPTLGLPLLLSPNGIAHAPVFSSPNVSPLAGMTSSVGQQSETNGKEDADSSSPISESETPKRSVNGGGLARQLSSSSEEAVVITTQQKMSESSEPGVDSPIAKALLDSAKGSGSWSRAIGAERKEKRDMARDNIVNDMAVLAHQARNRPAVGYRTPNDFFCGYGYSRSMNHPKQSMPVATPSLASHLPVVSESAESDEAADQMGRWPTHLQQHNQSRHRRFDMSTFERVPSVPQGAALVGCENSSVLARLLAQNGLTKYIPNFEEEQIDYSIFCTLTPEDLSDLHINTYVARKKIMDLIRACNSNSK